MKALNTELLSAAAIVLVGVIVLSGLAVAANAPAEAPPTVTRLEIEHSDVPGTDLETRLYLITYPPGASAPAHHHPVDGLGYILEGTARSAYGTQTPMTLVAGQAFHDLPTVPHTVFANTDPKRPLKFLVAYTVKKGAPVIETP